MKFDGNLVKLQLLWDTFDTTVNSDPLLEDIGNLSFLHGQLCGEGKNDIVGLEVTSASYTVAVDLFMDRYSNKHLMIDAHCSKLRHTPIESTYYKKLRSASDQIKRHILSMEALGQNVENEFMVSLIRSKLPEIRLPKLKKIKTWRTSAPRQILEQNWRNTCQLKNLKIDWLNWIEKRVTLKRNKKNTSTIWWR